MNLFKRKTKPEVKRELKPEELYDLMLKDLDRTKRERTLLDTITFGGAATAAGGVTAAAATSPVAISIPLFAVGVGSFITAGALGTSHNEKVELLKDRIELFKYIEELKKNNDLGKESKEILIPGLE